MSPASYYNRNRTKRQDYRREQYLVRGNGRRKMSKSARCEAESRRRQELTGSRIAYSTSIVSHRGHLDRKRTSEMCIKEDATIATLNEQKGTFKSAYREEWRDAYIRWIHRRIAEKVSDALDFINSLPHHSPLSWDEDTSEDIHSRRRIIAGYIQEAELCYYSGEIYGQVERDKMYVLKGACVNLLFFKRTYRF